MDVQKTSEFLVSVIDDKAVQIEFLKLTDKEAAVAWASLAEAIDGLYLFKVPQCVKDAFTRYVCRCHA